MKKLLVLVCLILMVGFAFAQQPFYEVTLSYPKANAPDADKYELYVNLSPNATPVFVDQDDPALHTALFNKDIAHPADPIMVVVDTLQLPADQAQFVQFAACAVDVNGNKSPLIISSVSPLTDQVPPVFPNGSTISVTVTLKTP